MRMVITFLLLLWSQSTWSIATTQTPITSAQIATATLSGLSCLSYNPIAGTCFWLVCSPFGCKVVTSNLVSHRNPDVVVSTYPFTGKTPWIELRGMLESMGSMASAFPYDLDGGNDVEATQDSGHAATQFREADVLGNPALSLMSTLEGVGMLCSSVTYSFNTHYLSSVDVLNWRYSAIEMFFPESLVPGMREIGNWPANSWGAVYPRTGFTTQNEDPKAAAIVAQRAADIATRPAELRLYWAMGSDCSQGGTMCWAPPPLQENNAATGVWQPIKPFPMPMCGTFGENDTTSIFSWADYKQDHYGDMMWSLWRPYSCCKRRGSFISVVRF